MKLLCSTRRVVSAVLAGMVGCLICNPANALDKPAGFPARNIEIINPFKAGGSTDVYLRTLIPALEKALGTRTLVVNETGGEGVRAFDDVVSRPADGHTVYAIGPEELINTVFGRVKFDQLTPVARVEEDVSVFWVLNDSPFKTWADVVSYAKTNPDKLIVAGSYGIDQIVTAMLFKEAGNLKVKYVPFSVGNEAVAALLGGHVQLLHEEPGGMTAQLEAKLVRPLIAISDQRIERLPEAAIAKAEGYQVDLARWRGIAVKKGTPPEIVKFLAQAFEEAAKSTAYKTSAHRMMTDLRSGYLGPDEFAAFLDRDLATYKKEMPALGLVR